MKPLPDSLLSTLAAHPGTAILTVEDGATRGGFGQSLQAVCGPRKAPFEVAAYVDQFIPQGSPQELEELAGVSAAALKRRLTGLLSQASG
jgi:deoxyxylulose-5-phosphate synthase